MAECRWSARTLLAILVVGAASASSRRDYYQPAVPWAHGHRRPQAPHKAYMPRLQDPFNDPATRLAEWVGLVAQPAVRRMLQFVPGLPPLLGYNASEAPVESGVSVVIMNWKRPRNVISIVKRYVGYTAVSEVIVLMCRKQTLFKLQHPKVRVVDAIQDNDKYGLSVRFKYCREARSRWVLVQDDDVWTSEESIRYMMSAKAAYPGSLVGCCGRDWRGSRISYIAHTSDPGPARIILTIMMLADRSVCDAFFDYAPLMEDIAKHGRPYWNGEDIFFSLLSYKLSGRLPMALSFRWGTMSQNDTGVHFGKAHHRYRDRFLRAAVQRLQLGSVPFNGSRKGDRGVDEEVSMLLRKPDSVPVATLAEEVVDTLRGWFGRQL